MNRRNLIVGLVVAALTLLSATTRAHADCTENGTGCAGLVGAIMGPVDGIQLAGGLVTMIGAVDVSRHRASRGWRVANYVIGSLNLASGLGLTGFAIAAHDNGFFSGFAA